jgi:hypothetical protein
MVAKKMSNIREPASFFTFRVDDCLKMEAVGSPNMLVFSTRPHGLAAHKTVISKRTDFAKGKHSPRPCSRNHFMTI